MKISSTFVLLLFVSYCFYGGQAGIAGVTSLRITPSINSGIPDPVYEIPHSNPNFTSIATIARIHVTGQLPSLLGYRGFSIQLEGLDIYRSRVADIPRCMDKVIEDKLL